MDTKQTKKILNMILTTISIFSLFLIVIISYLCFKHFVNLNLSFVIIIGILTVISCIFILINKVMTLKKQNKFDFAIIVYLQGILIVLMSIFYVYAYLKNILLVDFTYSIIICFLSLLVYVSLVFSFIIGVKINKFEVNNIMDITTETKTPSFEDEIQMRKKIAELKRKVEMKTAQEEAQLLKKILEDDDKI